VSSTLQVLINIISTVIGLGMLAVAGYILKNVLVHKNEIVKLQQDFLVFKTQTEERMSAMNKECAARLEWLRCMSLKLSKMDKNIVIIATKLDIAEKDLHTDE